jgi:hypothetical protein
MANIYIVSTGGYESMIDSVFSEKEYAEKYANMFGMILEEFEIDVNKHYVDEGRIGFDFGVGKTDSLSLFYTYLPEPGFYSFWNVVPGSMQPAVLSAHVIAKSREEAEKLVYDLRKELIDSDRFKVGEKGKF